MILIAATLALPYVTFADHNPINSNVFIPTILKGPLVICTGVPTTGGPIQKTCNNLCDLVAQIANVIYFMIAVVIWIIMPILVVIGGIMIMLSGANPEMLGRAKKTITGAVWGAVIVLAAWLIVYTFIAAFGGLGQYIGGFGQAACTVTTQQSTGNNVGGGTGNNGSSNNGGASTTNPFGGGGDSGGGGATGVF